MRFIKALVRFLAWGLVLAIVSCSSIMTIKDQLKDINQQVAKRDFATALKILEKGKAKYYEAKDRVMFYLDAGMLSHYAGDYAKSNEYLTRAEYAIEELYTASVSKAIGSLLLNDNALDYSGEDYEDIYLNVFKALNYIHLGSFDDAMVEIKRISIKLNMLEDKYRKLANEYNKDKDAKIKVKSGSNNFYNSALARYLSLIIYRAEGEWDSARIDRDKIKEAFSRQANYYPFPQPNLDNALVPNRNAKVTVISFTGRSPDKVAVTLRLRSEKNALVIVPSKENEQFRDEIKDFGIIEWQGIDPNYYFKLQFPVIKTFGSSVSGFRVIFTPVVSGQTVLKANGSPLESIERVAKLTFEVKKPLIYLKTIIRTIVKGLIAAEGKKQIQKNTDDLTGALLNLATDIVVDVSENADLRISHFFPAQASIADVDVAPGVYNVVVEYYTKNGSVVFRDEKGEIEIKKNSVNLIESFYLE